jgi:Domain of unknown function (DUF222)
MEVRESFEWLAGSSPVGADLAMCQVALAAVGVVERQAIAWRLAWHAQLESLADATPSIFPEQVNAEATGRSLRSATQDSRRTTTLAGSAPMRDLFEHGDVSVEHLDALSTAARSLEPGQRTRLLDDAGVVSQAAGRSPEEFAVVVRRRVREIRAEDGIARLAQQRRDRSFRSWTDRQTGMICFRGQLDPETGTAFINRIQLKADELFHDRLPDDCPSDPDHKQAYLRALALLALTETTHGHPGVVEVIVVIDADTIAHGHHDRSDVRCQHDVDLPVESVRRQMCTGVITPVIIRDGVVLDVGRTRRLATVGQRRALRAMYPTCAIPGCRTPFDHCQPHHIHWWRHGGTTDLANLLPLCVKHHHRAHEGGWLLHLQPDTRVLSVTLPDGTTMNTGPPTAHAG